MRRRTEMLTEEDRADAYREMTDGSRRLVRATRDSARQRQRVKPDLETHPDAAFDHEEEAKTSDSVRNEPGIPQGAVIVVKEHRSGGTCHPHVPKSGDYQMLY
jgi:hypothetical protein